MFDPMYVNAYSIDQLADMIGAGEVTLEQVEQLGLAAPKRPPLRAELLRRKQLRLADEEMWTAACNRNTVPAFEVYVDTYDKYPPEYRGMHVADAKLKIGELKEKHLQYKETLFESMRREPWKFKHESMKILMGGEVPSPEELEALKKSGEDEVLVGFLESGLKITYQELLDNDIIPDSISRQSLVEADYTLTQTNMDDLHYFPTDKRTDVYFIGVPRSGKSSVMAALCAAMHKKGWADYQAHYNNDNADKVRDYYYSLIKSTQKGKYPVSTQQDSLSFIKLMLKSKKKESPLTLVELGGEAFKSAFKTGKRGMDAWNGLAAGTCLESSNRKLLFFIIDYSALCDQDKIGEQYEVLESMLNILRSDGPTGNGYKGCTLSKVDTVAIIVTKSDMMDAELHEERMTCAIDFINENFASFKKTLISNCEEFGINKPVGFKPYVVPFSVGKMYIGNTYEFDPTDADALIEFISVVIAGNKTGFLGKIFG